MLSVFAYRKRIWNIIFFLQVITSLFIPNLLWAQEGMAEGGSSQHTTGQASDTWTAENEAPIIDLDEIIKRGTLRILVPTNLAGGLFLPRSDSPVAEQQGLAVGFAHSLGLKPEIIPVASFRDMFPALNQGYGDIIAANITVTDERKKKMAFSVPVDHAHQVVMVAKEYPEIGITKDLAGKSLLLNKATSFWKTGEDFQKRYPSIKLVPQNAYIFDEKALDLVAKGEYDATIRDSNIC